MRLPESVSKVIYMGLDSGTRWGRREGWEGGVEGCGEVEVLGAEWVKEGAV